ncbi:MAG: hypothetical protein R3F43_02930 [bacterium]
MTLEVDNTYVHGIRANVWEYALRKVPDSAEYKKALWADAEWLMQALGDRQAWRYSMNSQDWDNSCTQYGVLGLWAAERAGFDPGDAFWQKMSDHFLTVQGEDGGWGYQTGGSSANMATAGLASTFLVFDMLHARSVYSRANPRAFKEGLGEGPGGRRAGDGVARQAGRRHGQRLLPVRHRAHRRRLGAQVHGATRLVQGGGPGGPRPAARRRLLPQQLHPRHRHRLQHPLPGVRRRPRGHEQAAVRRGPRLEPQPP